jgi:antitoxin MazE
MTTKRRIIRIGNSRGIRVPKVLIEKAQLPEEVEVRAEPGRLVVEGVRRARAGWAAAAKAMHDHGDDELLDAPAATRFDRQQWHWR